MIITHIPVLLKESLYYLAVNPVGIYIDASFGSGGHAFAINEKLSPQGMLIAFDRDEEVISHFSTTLPDNLYLFHSTFSYIQHFLKYLNIDKVDGILADLGMSTHQLESPHRGFSYQIDAPLDMRMNKNAELTATLVINTYSLEELTKIFRTYGELKEAYKLSQLIVEKRKTEKIDTTQKLVEAIKPVTPSKGTFAFLSKVFQAIRIEVNQELKELESLLLQAEKWLKPQGRLVLISYHSLEDKLIKEFLNKETIDYERMIYGKRSNAEWKPLTKKPVTPSAEEIKSNPKSRSAKLRAAEKL